jgi:TolB-like protein
MPGQNPAFGPFSFDRASATLWRDGMPIPLGGRGAALLAALLEADGGVVTKSALIERAWPGTIVEDGNLAVQIATLRKTLGTRPDGEEWIANIARVGYRLVRDAGPVPQTGRPSIAVLPFLNLSSDPEQEYFADGVVEDLITGLSRFKTFGVVARNSTFTYKGRAVDVRDVARELGVRYVLEGSVRRDDRQVRVSVQLLDGASGAHRCAENFDGALDGLFDFQDRVTASIVGLIEPQIRQAEVERARRKRPENLDAYDLYHRALPAILGVLVTQLTHYDEAIEMLGRAIELDPDFASALALAAWAHEKRLTRGGIAPPGVDDAARAIELSERALVADGSDSFVVMVAGVVALTIKGEEDVGASLIRRAALLNPHSLIIANTASYAAFHLGQFDEAVAVSLRAIKISPAAPELARIITNLARSHLSAGRIEEALAWGLRGIEEPATTGLMHGVLAAAYAHLGQMEQARAVVRAALDIWPALTIKLLLGRVRHPPSHDRLLVDGLLKAGMPMA